MRGKSLSKYTMKYHLMITKLFLKTYKDIVVAVWCLVITQNIKRSYLVHQQDDITETDTLLNTKHDSVPKEIYFHGLMKHQTCPHYVSMLNNTERV